MSLIVTGSVGIDSVEAPTGKAEEVLGGSVVYFAAAASFFGPVRVVAAVGEDFPPSFLERLNRFDLDLAGLEQRRGSKTFRWRGRYHENMNLRDTIDVQLNVLAEKLPVVPAPFRDSQYVFLANTHPAGQLALLENFPDRSLAVADTMDLWIRTEKPALLELLSKVDGLVLNDSEAQELTGKTNLITAAGAILDLGPQFVVVKKGEHGSMLVCEDRQVVILPAFPTAKVVDPTGAGDSFAGGMMGCLASTRNHALAGLRKALAYGTVLASFNIESFSLDRLAQITREDIESRLRDYRGMLTIEA